jgi:hypothetical protein
MTVAKCDLKNDCLEALKITALKAITNNNVTAEAGVGFINDSKDGIEKYNYITPNRKFFFFNFCPKNNSREF